MLYSDWSISGEYVDDQSPETPLPLLVDIDALLDRLSELAGERSERRRLGGGLPPPRSTAHREPRQPGNGDGAHKIDLVLYTSAASDKSQRAVRTIQHVLSQYDGKQVRFAMCDLSQRPTDGEADSVVFTPTLVKKGPGPRMSIIGNLEHEDILREILEASGVERRRWDD